MQPFVAPKIIVVGQPFIRESQLRAKIKPLGVKIEYREIDASLKLIPSADYIILHKPAEHIKRLASKSSEHIIYVNHGGVHALAKAVEDIADTLPPPLLRTPSHHPSFALDKLPSVKLPAPVPTIPPMFVAGLMVETAPIPEPPISITGIMPQDNPQLKAPCPICDHPFVSEAMMQAHVKSRHPEAFTRLFPPTEKESPMAKRMVKCEYCDKMLVDRPQAIGVHIKGSHPEHFTPKNTYIPKPEKVTSKLIEGRPVQPAVTIPLNFCPKCGAQGPHKEYCTDCGLRTGTISRHVEIMRSKGMLTW